MSYISVGAMLDLTTGRGPKKKRPKRWGTLVGGKVPAKNWRTLVGGKVPAKSAPVLATSVLAAPTLIKTLKAATPSIMTAPPPSVVATVGGSSKPGGGGGGGGGGSDSWTEESTPATDQLIDKEDAEGVVAKKASKSMLIPLAIGAGVLFLLLK